MKIKFGFLLLSLIHLCVADEAIEKRNNAITQLKSTFNAQPDTFTTFKKVSLPSEFDVTLDNKWQLNFKSRKPINISQIKIVINDVVAISKVNLEVKPNIRAYYFFADVNVQKYVQSIAKGYSFLGVYKQITPDDLSDFTTFSVQKLEVIITWSDENKTYNQLVTNFLLVIAK